MTIQNDDDYDDDDYDDYDDYDDNSFSDEFPCSCCGWYILTDCRYILWTSDKPLMVEDPKQRWSDYEENNVLATKGQEVMLCDSCCDRFVEEGKAAEL